MLRISIVFATALFLSGSSAFSKADEVAQLGPFDGPNNLKILVRAEGPATRVTPLQAACFFEHQAEGDVLSGGTKMFNDQMGGLVQKLRDSGDFGGHELETLLITPKPGTVPAKKILLIGLGDPKTFTASRMKKIGIVAVREAFKLGVDKLSFSPNVTDAGVTTVKVGEFDQQVIEGVLQGLATQKQLAAEQLAPAVVLSEFTLEAGKVNLPGAAEAVKVAIKTIEEKSR